MNGLASIKPEMVAGLAQTDKRPNDLQAAAEQFEALFIHQLLKQARSAKLAEDILGSEAGDTYTEMLDQERAKQLSAQMSLGVADLSASFWHHLPSPHAWPLSWQSYQKW